MCPAPGVLAVRMAALWRRLGLVSDPESIGVGLQCPAPFGGIDAEVGQVVDDGSVPATRVVGQEGLHPGPGRRSHRLAGDGVDAFHHREVVRHELVKPHVDRPVRG